MRQHSAATARQRKRAANQEAGDEAEQGNNTGARHRKRAANQEASDKAGQLKNTKARQRKGAANQEAGDKAEQGNDTVARQRKRAGIRVRAKTGIQPWASARPVLGSPGAKGADLGHPRIFSLASPHRPKARDGTSDAPLREYI